MILLSRTTLDENVVGVRSGGCQTMVCVGGSGRMSYSLNDTKASAVPSDDTRSIEVYPIAPGFVSVSVADKLLPHTEQAEGLVIVTLVGRIVISVRDEVSESPTLCCQRCPCPVVRFDDLFGVMKCGYFWRVRLSCNRFQRVGRRRCM